MRIFVRHASLGMPSIEELLERPDVILQLRDGTTVRYRYLGWGYEKLPEVLREHPGDPEGALVDFFSRQQVGSDPIASGDIAALSDSEFVKLLSSYAMTEFEQTINSDSRGA